MTTTYKPVSNDISNGARRLAMLAKRLIHHADMMPTKHPDRKGPGLRLVNAAPADLFDTEEWVTLDAIRFDGCGTAVCAAGLAASLPEFQAEGLSLGRAGSQLYPHYRGYDCEEALQKFFEIPVRWVEHIFMPCTYPVSGDSIHPLQVAKRIMDYLVGNSFYYVQDDL